MLPSCKKDKDMCTYNVVIDDQLVAEAERSLNGLSLQAWLQQQVDALVRHSKSSAKRVAKVKRRANYTPSDAELTARFSNQDMPPMPEETSWKDIIDSNLGKTIKSVEKWL